MVMELIRTDSWRFIRLRRARIKLLYGAIVLVSLYFGSSLIFGNRGILANNRIIAGIDAAQNYLAFLSRDEARLQRQIDLLVSKKRDPDMLEETIRKELGYGKPHEIVVLLQRNDTNLP
ncbi:MAG: septum formation initiator family protein [Alphaproteobacteria bacterium]|nr:septum formation initiator family protein [Alphaproteobacteria bacterium]